MLGGPWILIVMFGLHWAFIPVFINNIAIHGMEPVMGLLAANQLAMAGSVFAVAILLKDKTKKSGTALLCKSGGAGCWILRSNSFGYGWFFRGIHTYFDCDEKET